MTTVRDLLEILGGLPKYTLDHSVSLAVSEDARIQGEGILVDLRRDGVVLQQHYRDAAEYPVSPDAIDERLADD